MSNTITLKDYIQRLKVEGKIDDPLQVYNENDTRRRLLEKSFVIRRTKRGIIVSNNSDNFILERKLDSENTFRIKLPQKNLGIINYLTFKKWDYFDLRFYPNNLEHAEIFSNSNVKEGGPSNIYPGSVAVVSCEFYRSTWRNELNLKYSQYCFKRDSPIELTGSLARKYMGARKLLLETALDNLHCFAFRRPRLDIHPGFKKGGNVKDLIEVIMKNRSFQWIDVDWDYLKK
jgi:hypothetical protein